MPTEKEMEAFLEGDHRLLDKNETTSRFSDLCNNCGHSRADHLVNPAALNLQALSDCNRETRRYGEIGDTEKIVIEECDCERWIYA